MKEICGFEFENNLANRMQDNAYCHSIIHSLRRSGIVYFQVDNSPEQQEALELLEDGGSCWDVWSIIN